MGVLTRLSLFAYGFRPFFLGAACSGLVLVPWWAASFSFGVSLATDWPSTLWHAHEMLFGFTCAAIAGFLLTAVPSWTGRRGFAGGPLVLMTALWLLGRVLVASSASWPFAAVVAADLAFLPVLAAFLDATGLVLKTVRMRRFRLGLPVWKARIVVEAEAGAFERWGLRVGDQIELRE